MTSEQKNYSWGIALGIFILTILVVIGCGGTVGKKRIDERGGREKGPWERAGRAFLLKGERAVTQSVRGLLFEDGVSLSYDGSDTGTGEEEVCRHIRREENHYEICMPLDDDPYFMAGEPDALVWNPLFFERFGTELFCRIWVEGMSAKTEVDCEDIWSYFGSGNFHCEAGLINGDRALKCSDEWAVAINGYTDDTKSICRVYTGDGSGRCLGAPKFVMVNDENGQVVLEQIPDEELILEMQRSSWNGYQSSQMNEGQFAQGESAWPSVPQDLPEGAVFSYHSRDEDVCSVDESLGMVSIGENLTPPIYCKVVLTIEAEGFADRVLFDELSVLKNNDTAWADYNLDNNVLYVGERLAAGAVTSSEPASPELEFVSLEPSICTVDSVTGEVVAIDAGLCDIRLYSRAEDHQDVAIDKSFTVTARIDLGDIVWSDFPSTALVGVPTGTLAAPQIRDLGGNLVSDSTLVVTISHTAGECAWDGINNILSFSGLNECILSVTASGLRGHNQYEKMFRVTPDKGSLNLSWAGYGTNVAVFGADPPSLELPATNPTNLGAQYSYSATGGGCAVDATTGALTLLGASGGQFSCRVTVSATLDSYEEATVEHLVTINKGNQVLNAPASPYGSAASLVNSGELELIHPPQGGFGHLDYQVTGDCTVAGNGKITANASGTTGCVVEARWLGDDNYNPSGFTAIATIPIVASGNSAVPSWVSAPYANNPTVGGASVSLVASPISNASSGAGAIEFRSGSPGVCEVGASDGALSGTAVGDCTVQARFIGSATQGASAWTDSPIVVVLKGQHPALAADPYGASPQVAVGETLAFAVAPVGHGAADYTIKENPAHCRVAMDGVITGLSVGICTVEVAFAGDANYNAFVKGDLQAIDVIKGSQNLIFSGPYGAEPSVRSGETLTVDDAPTGSEGGAISYRVKTGSEDYCSVGGVDGTVAGLGVGSCIIQAQAEATTNYHASDWKDIATITIEVGVLMGIVWNAGYSEAQVGAPMALNRVDIGSLSDATIAYRVVEAGETGCAFNDADAERTLTFEDQGRCVVAATVQKEHYDVWEQRHTVDVALGILQMGTGAWGQFSGSLVVGGPSMTPQGGSGAVTVAVDYSEADAQGRCPQYDDQGNPLSNRGDCPEIETPVSLDDIRVTWELLRGEWDCRLLNYRSGEVEALRVPIEVDTKCSIVGTAEMRGYRWDKSQPIEVPLAQGRIRLASAPRHQNRLVNPDNTVQLPAGENLTLESDGHPKAVDLLDLEVGYGVQGFVAGSDDEKPNVCSVDDVGTISAGSNQGKGDICRLMFTLRDPIGAYEDFQGFINFVVAFDDLIFSSVPVLSYGNGAKLKLGVTAPLTPTGLPSVDDSTTPVNVVWKYELEQLHSDAASLKEGVCNVDVRWQIEMMANPDYGKITLGPEASKGDICRVKAYATAAGYNWYEGVAAVDLVVDGWDIVLTQNGTVPVYPDELLRGEVAAPDVVATQDDNGIDITWSGWEVLGTDINHDGTADDANVCSIDNTTGEVSTGSAASAGDRCVVYGVASATTAENYNEVRVKLADYTIKDTFISLVWTDFPASATVGDALVLGLPVSVPATSNITIAVASGDCTWSDATRTLSFSDLAPCEVNVVASLPNYVDIERNFRVAPQAGGITVVGADDDARWGNYEVVTVGEGGVDAPDIGATIPPGVRKAYTTTTTNTCSVNEQTGAVTGRDDSTCEVTLTLSKDGFTSTTHTYTISVQEGTMGVLTAPTYAGTLAVRGTISVSSVPTGAPAGGTWTYGVTGKRGGIDQTGICSIVESTGRLSATADAEVGDVCEVTATASATGYADKAASVVSLTVSNRQSLDITWTGYTPSTVTWVAGGPTAPVLNAPSFSSSGSGVTSGINVSYAVGDGVTNCTVVESTGALTINGAGTCQVVLTVEDSTDLDEASYVTNMETMSVTVAKASQTLTAPSDPYGSGASLKVGQTPLAIVNTPQGGEGSLEYASGDETVCTVGAGDGLLTPVAPGNCTVTAKWSGNENYLASDGVTLFTTTIGNGVISVADWGSYETVTVGMGSVAAPTLSATPAGVGKSYSTTSTACEVDGNGAVTGLDDGTDNCEIQLALTQTHYDSTAHTYTISVQEGTLGALSAQGYTSDLKVGGAAVPVTTNPSGAPDGVSSTWSYAAVGKRSGTVTANICTVDNVGAVSPGTDARPNDICEVTATLTATGYAAKSASTVTLTVGAGVIAVADWGSYETVTVGAGSVSAPSLTVTPTSVTKTYSTTSTACRVDGNGAVTGLDDGTDNCEIQLALTQTHYDSTAHTYTISVQEGTLGALSAQGYTARLRVGGAAVPVTTNPSGAPDGVSSTWSYAAVGKRSGTVTANICTVDTAGAVSPGTDARPNDICEVTATVAATGYAVKSASTVTLTVGAGVIAVADWGSYETVTVGAGSVSAPTISATPAGVGKSYSTTSTACEVDGNGAVTGLDDGTDNCEIQLVLSQTHYDSTAHTYTISVQEGTMGALAAPAYAGTLAVRGTISVSSVPTGAPAGGTWTYGVTGKRGGVDQTGICSIVESTGRLSATADAEAGDVCEVTATASATGYADKAASVVSLTVSNRQSLDIAWTGYTPSTVTWVAGGPTAPVLNAPSFSSSGSGVTSGINVSYAVGDGVTNCTVVESTGALTINGAGTCQVVLTVEDSTDLDEGSYVTNTDTATVTVAKASQTLTAPSDSYGSGASLKVGQTPLAIVNAPQGGEGSLVYASVDETVCTVGASDGLLTPVTPGSCTVTAKWSGNEDYLASDGVTLFTTTIGNGVISVTDWGSYETVTVGAGSVAAPSLTVTPTSVTKTYSTTSTACQVDGNGAVTGLDDGT